MAFVYSFCFWFSLRLGGILIGIFSMLQGFFALIFFCIAKTRQEDVKVKIEHLLNNLKLLYVKDYLENIKEDPGKFVTYGICLACFYIFLCILYIYGAYTYKNGLMLGFIIAEFFKFVGLSTLVITWLLILKQNSLDIGLLIGASVAGGFFLLGMFYLWVCASNLPILINEMKHDEQAATIATLRQILQENPRPTRDVDFVGDNNDIFTVPRKRTYYSDTQTLIAGTKSRALPYYY